MQLLLNQFSFHLCCRKLRKCSCLSLNPSCRLPLFPPQNCPSWLKSACTTQRPTHTTLSRTGGIHSLMEDFQTRYSPYQLPSCICVNHVFMKSVAAVVLGVCCECVLCVCCECCFISAFVRLFRSPPPRIRVKLDMWIFLIGLNAGKETSQTWDCSHRCSLLTLTLNKRGVKMSRLINVMFWKGCEAADKVLCVSVRPSENFAAFCCLLHSGLSHRPQKFQASNKCPFQGHLCTRGHWGVKCWV